MNVLVSLGEAIDKLSILQIKRENITDARKLDVEKEYLVLYEILKDFVVRYAELYESMLATNRVIWGQMDVLRDGVISDVEYTRLCRECIVTNDVRFRIKNKINLISNSFRVITCSCRLFLITVVFHPVKQVFSDSLLEIFII